MRTLLIASQKSGVGTTTAAVNLAALTPARVLLVDVDPHIRAAGVVGAPGPGEADPVAGRGAFWPRVAGALDLLTPFAPGSFNPVADIHHFTETLSAHGPARYDTVFVNCPASADPDVLNALLATVTELVLVLSAEGAAFRTLPDMLERVRAAKTAGAKVQVRGIVLTLPEQIPAGGRAESVLRAKFDGLFPSAIPFDPVAAAALAVGQPLVQFAPSSAAARQYHALAQHLNLGPTPAPAARPPVGDASAPTPSPATPRARTETYYADRRRTPPKGPDLRQFVPPAKSRRSGLFGYRSER